MFNDYKHYGIDLVGQYIIGSDEVGTGACAGPAYVCAVKAKIDWDLIGLADSKRLSERKRVEVGKKILEQYKSKDIRYSCLEVTSKQIDEFGLGQSIKAAHSMVINNLACDQSVAIVDGKINVEAKCPTFALIKADSKIPTVMAASILAKNYRDELMKKLHLKHPEYEWNKNVGYVVQAHKEAIKKYGLTPFHRKSYKLKDI